MLSNYFFKKSIAVASVQCMKYFSTSSLLLKAAVTTTITKPTKPRNIKTKKLTITETKKQEKPKRPLSAFSLYYKENIEKFYIPNSGVKVTEALTAAAANWKTLSETVKEDYKIKAQPYRKAYEDAYNEWQLKYKRPLSGYNKFIKTKMAELKSTSLEDNKEAFKRLGKDWKLLTDEEKKEWKNKEI